MPYNVFVSYSTKDIPDVNALRAALQFPEVQVFVSEYAVAAGAPLAPTIQANIQNCDLFVLIWSKNAAGSEWVPQEIGIAHALKKPILPFVLQADVSLPGFISGIRYVAAYQNPQQATMMLREAVLRNSLVKQNQQNTLGLLAIGGLLLWFFKSAK
jgi:TIR domain